MRERGRPNHKIKQSCHCHGQVIYHCPSITGEILIVRAANKKAIERRALRRKKLKSVLRLMAGNGSICRKSNHTIAQQRKNKQRTERNANLQLRQSSPHCHFELFYFSQKKREHCASVRSEKTRKTLKKLQKTSSFS